MAVIDGESFLPEASGPRARGKGCHVRWVAFTARPAQPAVPELEAKRRLAAGEFPALHDAQAAIAGEHGLPSWAALKQACARQESHALAHLRWMIARFSGADGPQLDGPGEDELRQHFDDRFLAALPPGYLVEQTAKMAADLRAELVVIGQGAAAGPGSAGRAAVCRGGRCRHRRTG